MGRVLLVAMAALLLVGAAPRPGGLSREGMTPAARADFEGPAFARDCAAYFHYRASHEPGSARGKAAAQARDWMIDRVMALQTQHPRAAVTADIEKKAENLRQGLLGGRFDPVEALEGFSLCDQEFRLGLVEIWAIPTGPETREGAAYFATRDFADLCAGTYRHVGRTSSGSLASAALRAEGAATAELARHSRRPLPEATAAAAVRARGLQSALSDGRLSYGQLQQAVQLCDQQLGLRVDAEARLSPAMCESIVLAGVERRARQLQGVPMSDPRRMGAAVQARCSIARDTLAQLRAGKCTGDPLALGQTALREDQDQLSRLNNATDQTLRCEGD